MSRRNTQKYGAPLYGVAWPTGDFIYMAGGGNMGIENKVVVVKSLGLTLSEELTKFNTGTDAAYRLAAHPSGQALVLGMAQGGVQVVDIHRHPEDPDKTPELRASPISDSSAAQSIGVLKSLSFSSDGKLLALGYESGRVEIRSWPDLDLVRGWQASASKAIRSADFSLPHGDGILMTTDEQGLAWLWNADDGERVMQLPPPADMPPVTFFRCQSARDAGGVVIFAAVKSARKGHVLKFRQLASGELRLEARTRGPVTDSPICGFVASPSGALLGCVTPDGDQVVLRADTLTSALRRPQVHMTFATALAFSSRERHIVSVSADASAVLSPISRVAGEASTLLILQTILALMLAIALYVYFVL